MTDLWRTLRPPMRCFRSSQGEKPTLRKQKLPGAAEVPESQNSRARNLGPGSQGRGFLTGHRSAFLMAGVADGAVVPEVWARSSVEVGSPVGNYGVLDGSGGGGVWAWIWHRWKRPPRSSCQGAKIKQAEQSRPHCLKSDGRVTGGTSGDTLPSYILLGISEDCCNRLGPLVSLRLHLSLHLSGAFCTIWCVRCAT